MTRQKKSLIDLANLPANTIIGNDSSSPAVPEALTVAEVIAMGIGGGGGVAPVDPSVVGNLVSFADTTGGQADSGIAAVDLFGYPDLQKGTNEITNGSFDSDASDWVVGAGWAWESDGYGGGWMRHTAGNTEPLMQAGVLAPVYYRARLNTGGTTGGVTVTLDGGSVFYVAAGDSLDVDGWWELDSGNKIVISPTSDFDGYVDDVEMTRMAYIQEVPLAIGGKNFARNSDEQWVEILADKSIAIVKLADGTDGELITWDADGVATTVPVGTATHVLTSNGAGAAPTFQAPGGVPGGVDTNIQYNNGGALGGDDSLTWNNASKQLTIGVEAGTSKLAAPDATTADTDGGGFDIQAGQGKGAGNGGAIRVFSGFADLTGGGEQILFQAGSGGSISGSGGDITFRPGYGDVNGKLRITDPSSFLNVQLDTSLLATSSKTFIFPNKDGTFALIDDIVNILSATIYDEFGRADTSAGDLGTAPSGHVWDLRGSYVSSYPLPAGTSGQIIDHRFVVVDTTVTCYATQTLRAAPSRIGARVSWTAGNGGTQAGVIAMIISLNDNFISDMLHFYISRTGWTFQLRVAGGSFDTVASETFATALLKDGTSYPIEYSVSGDTVTVMIAGEVTSFRDARVSSLLGGYAFWEITYLGESTYESYARIDSVWTGSSPLGGWIGNIYHEPVTGRVLIGNGGDVGALTQSSWSVEAASGDSRMGVESVLSVTPTEDMTSGSEFALLFVNKPLGDHNHFDVEGVGGFVQHAGTGVVAHAFGGRMGIQLYETGGSVTNYTGQIIPTPLRVSGDKTIGTAKGLTIEAQKTAFVTTAYGINAEGADDINYMAGSVRTGKEIVLGGQTTQIINSKNYTLADDASADLEYPQFCGQMFISSDVAASWIFFTRGGAGAANLVADPLSVGAVADTDGKLCVYWTGTKYVIKNRLGSSLIFYVTYIGFA